MGCVALVCELPEGGSTTSAGAGPGPATPPWLLQGPLWQLAGPLSLTAAHKWTGLSQQGEQELCRERA